ncbi:hypothetical protein P154DRAFT_523725 [Amniculicola lignicola CBS 123094]|uniref:FUN14-domain-containing protein n=1 Tax=Amniculicola lignicola CBS 123094 TaxID=1392246 RepID=A0A6A5WIA9_9PLEO|nr:hypothetical protein P154DRAFT_523725 [Amniculicola lignicola CBS 123094]
MAFLHPGLRPTILFSMSMSIPMLLCTPLLTTRYSQPIRCDASPNAYTNITSDLKSQLSGSSPIRTTTRRPHPAAVRQVSLGSILGVLGGLGVSVFSKPLAVLIGLGVVIVQVLESRGIHIIPYSYLGRRFQQTNVRSLLQDNPAFKFSFGITFALAAFAEF